MTIRIGVIGYGYWGPNLVRNFNKIEGFEMIAVADLNPKRLAEVKRVYPKIETTTDADKLLDRGDIDAVSIVTPISTHFKFVEHALKKGKHVLVEKPMAENVLDGSKLIKLAKSNNKTLMVDHTFIYSGAVRKIKEIIDKGELGEIYYFDSVRVNLGLFQHDYNVLWDLGPHDFSIMNFLLDRKPRSISAVGTKPIQYGKKALESICYVTVNFEDETLAHFHLSWLSPVKIRRTIIGGSKKMIVYDHLDPDNQVKIYNKGVDAKVVEEKYNVLVQYRTGDMYAPKVDQTEALEVLCKHFLESIENNTPPLTDGYAGLRVLEMLQAAQKSLLDNGKAIELRIK